MARLPPPGPATAAASATQLGVAVLTVGDHEGPVSRKRAHDYLNNEKIELCWRVAVARRLTEHRWARALCCAFPFVGPRRNILF